METQFIIFSACQRMPNDDAAHQFSFFETTDDRCKFALKVLILVSLFLSVKSLARPGGTGTPAARRSPLFTCQSSSSRAAAILRSSSSRTAASTLQPSTIESSSGRSLLQPLVSHDNNAPTGSSSIERVDGLQQVAISHDNNNNKNDAPVAAAGGTATTEEEEKAGEKKEADSLLEFSRDTKRVLHDLRGADIDPCIPKHLMGGPSTLSYTKTWTLEDWESHNSRKRYFRYMLNFPKSRLLRRTAPQLLCLFGWAVFSGFAMGSGFFQRRQLPLSALGTISTFLAFLLTLRSNQGLSRLDEARRTWSKVVEYSREMSQLISAFVYPVDKQLALMLSRHVSIFGWLLKNELQFSSNNNKNKDVGCVKDIVRTMLPNKQDADYILSQRQRTAAVVTRIRQVVAHLGKQHRLTTAEEMALDHTAHSLSEVITSTGRIRSSPIPTLYTSHTNRLMVFYLFCLPPALVCSGLDGIVTTLITMVVGYAMLGLDEMSHLFEQPFRVVPMYQISKRSMIAVADSLTCRPPPLAGEIRDKEEEHLTQKELTTYWSKSEMALIWDDIME